PGSKTTQISQHMENTGIVVANDNRKDRIRSLANNIDRSGILNTVITNYDGRAIGNLLPEYFDRVLVDVPCSAEGTIRQSLKVLYHWGGKNIERLSRLQIGLLISGFKSLRKRGVLVYSTCTFAPEENEYVVDYLLRRFPKAEIEPVKVRGLKRRPGIIHWQGAVFSESLKGTARIYPQDNDTSGFFIARIRKG
ncbi:MAG TPA: RsmB/NOP family class I SAM-dependent RNA methyltransferase, partial [bacterium (Candidatus Stahlbacteria)]|nr:RsmB/NOP family class I SAM-dependent RNA methyltransferase [Candidatus Stahlbacteria bacterium]